MSPQLYNLTANIKAVFAKHHPVLFISFVALLLAAAIFSLYQVLDITTAPASDNSTVTGFDKVTADKIKKLHDSSDSSENLVFPTPRSNPFME